MTRPAMRWCIIWPALGGTHDPLPRFVACFIGCVPHRFRHFPFRSATFCQYTPSRQESRCRRHGRRGKHVRSAEIRPALHGKISSDLDEPGSILLTRGVHEHGGARFVPAEFTLKAAGRLRTTAIFSQDGISSSSTRRKRLERRVTSRRNRAGSTRFAAKSTRSRRAAKRLPAPRQWCRQAWARA